MTANMEIICVGNELLIGKTLNTNAQWLAKHATLLGATVTRVTTIADDIQEISAAIQEALKRKPNFIITTGGLGPTFDDKTLAGVAKALNRKLEVNQKALDMVKEKYEAYAAKLHTGTLELTQPRIKMATLPEKTTPIRNPVGTAPAVQTHIDGTTLIVLPGVPKEMEAIFEETVTPQLKQTSNHKTFHEKSIYVDKVMESSLAPFIDQVMYDNPDVYVKSHPKGEENKPHIEIHLSTTAAENEKPEEKLRAAVTELSGLIEKAGGTVFADENRTLGIFTNN
jgi:nicotinamide-nucleotide amidase